MVEPGIPVAVHERKRAAIVAQIPRRYSPTLHLAFPTVLGLTAIAASLAWLESPGFADLLAIPITLLASFGFEWRVHKDVLHRRLPLLSLLYDRHELAHHVIYTYDDMAMRDRREFFLVLMPAYAIVLVFLLDLPLALLTAHFAGRDAGALMLCTSMMFFLSYEWLHLAYHLPKGHLLGRLPLIAKLREHHRRHHDPRLMKRWNFNVTVPLFDRIHGTVWSQEAETRRTSRRRPPVRTSWSRRFFGLS